MKTDEIIYLTDKELESLSKWIKDINDKDEYFEGAFIKLRQLMINQGII